MGEQIGDFLQRIGVDDDICVYKKISPQATAILDCAHWLVPSAVFNLDDLGG
jgi:hypothetical protein